MKNNPYLAQSKSSPILNELQDNQYIFNPNQYRFAFDNSSIQVVYAQDNHQNHQLKTYLTIDKQLNSEELNLITMKIIHRNIIGLRKIGKSKKMNQEHLYWLYYECIDNSLENYIKTTFDRDWNKMKYQLGQIMSDLTNLMNYNKVYTKIEWHNIGITSQGVFKIYLPAMKLVGSLWQKQKLTKSQLDQNLDKNMTEIMQKFNTLIQSKKNSSCKMLKSPNKSTIDIKQMNNNNNRNQTSRQFQKNTTNTSMSRFQKIRNDLQRIRMKIKSDDKNHPNKNINPSVKVSPSSKNVFSLGQSPSSKRNSNLRTQSQLNANQLSKEAKNENKNSIFRRTNTLNPSESHHKQGQKPTIQDKFINNKESKSIIFNHNEPNEEVQQNIINQPKNSYSKQPQLTRQQKIHQQNINCINIYHHTNQIMDSKNVAKNTGYQQRLSALNNNIRNLQYNRQYNQRNYDEESVDTYQMELGQDFEMPNLVNDKQKLRQTALSPKDKWDTFTVRNKGNNKNNNQIETPEKNKYGNLLRQKKIHQSAGQNFFHKFHQRNQIELERDNQSEFQDTTSYMPGKQRLNQKQSSLFQSRTINDHRMFKQQKKKSPKNDKINYQNQWQSSTIKSAYPFPSNIQDRVQQALAKTRNVMTILKIPKSNSLGK